MAADCTVTQLHIKAGLSFTGQLSRLSVKRCDPEA